LLASPQLFFDSTSAVVPGVLTGTTQVTFTVDLSPAVPSNAVTVDYQTADIDATGSVDYTPVSGTITFQPLQTQQQITIPVLADTFHAGDGAAEKFSVSLSNPTGGATLAPTGTTATAEIDDSVLGGGFQFSTGTYTAVETAGNALITVNRTGGSAALATVQYATGGGSAVPGVDYQPTSGTLSFASNETSKTFSIPILSNAQPGGPNKTVGLVLSNPDSNSLIGPQGDAALVLLQQPPGNSVLSITPTVTVPAVLTGATQATFTVTLSPPNFQRLVTVHYQTFDGSATNGLDYVATSGTLQFQPNEFTKQITVPVLAEPFDPIDQPLETFTVVLSNATNATISPNGGTGTAGIDDTVIGGGVQFSAANYTGPATPGTALITVIRTGGFAFPVTVNYATGGGTAVPGVDYVPASGTVTFLSANQLSASFPVQVLSNPAGGPNKTVGLTLSNPSLDTILGPQSTAVLTLPQVAPDLVVLNTNDSGFGSLR